MIFNISLFVRFKESVVFFTALRIPEIQELLGHAVNNIVKHYYKPEKEVRDIP